MKLIVKAVLSTFYFSILFYIFFLARRRRGVSLPWRKRHVNLIPLKEKIEYIKAWQGFSAHQSRDFYTDLFGNIILFIPFAFFLVFVFHVKGLRRILLISLITSISIEFLQFLFSIGVADIDDIILNVTGAALGAGMLKLLLQSKLFHLKN